MLLLQCPWVAEFDGLPVTKVYDVDGGLRRLSDADPAAVPQS